MKNGKFAKRGVATKTLVMALAIMLVVGCTIGGTLAWLTDSTDEVENTFTIGNVDITLTETTGDEYKMVPGAIIEKDPVVTVEAGSEACWVFVEITESDNLSNFISYKVGTAWTALEDVDGVYYIDQADLSAAGDAAEYSVLEGDTVSVLDTVTKGMMDKIKDGEAEEPTLTFQAYAIQKEGFDTAAEAWKELNA